VVLACICANTQADGNFCKPLLDYTKIYNKVLEVSVCRTRLEKECKEVNKKLCLNVTEMKCEVGLFPNCTMDWRWENAVDFNMTMKSKVLKKCTKVIKDEVHQKMVYQCNNVTKQHCTAIWKVNDRGEKVWAGNENDCRNVTFEECKPAMMNYTIPAPNITCVDDVHTYPSFANITTRLMVDVPKCKVLKKAVCSPVTSKKCASVKYSECREIPTTDCKPAKETVPFQDEIHKQWCLLDKKKNIDLNNEVRKIVGNSLSFPMSNIQSVRGPRSNKNRSLLPNGNVLV